MLGEYGISAERHCPAPERVGEAAAETQDSCSGDAWLETHRVCEVFVGYA
jgi:hypothetical protein